ncbi:adhesive plaque matrix protein-like [Spodoptera frugiperda]|uniref:Adhesive plaque matrix protein-like n=1 Tax=Spodoptera frugiperda TaxID=7108 RepID=A0A9R0F2P8_SPOFR|nr:adhesive plaque matrix protein-like [Spodoptera frugiperda]XP_050559666.1 adhesive plaque matrix protein-like [Spodoptera frugiperda]
MWSPLLAIIALCITISHSHDGSQDRNIVKPITGQAINTNRVRRFLTGASYPGTLHNRTTGYNIVKPGYNINQNTTQQYVNNFNFSKPGMYRSNVNSNSVNSAYPTTTGHRQYPGSYAKHQAPLPGPNNSFPAPKANLTRNNHHSYPVSSTTRPLYPPYPGYYTKNQATTLPNNQFPNPNQNTHHSYPVSSTMRPGYTPNWGNYSNNQTSTLQPNKNLRNPTQNNNHSYPASSTMRPGYTPNWGNYSNNQTSTLQPNKNLRNPTQNNHHSYPVSSTMRPGYPQNPSNHPSYPAQVNWRIKNMPTTNATSFKPGRNNSNRYPVSNTGKPGYNNSNSKGEPTDMDAEAIKGNGNCPEGTKLYTYTNQCVNETELIYYDDFE